MKEKKTKKPTNVLQDDASQYGFIHKSEEEKLKEDIFRPDKEKLQLFVKMLKRNASLKKAVITRKIK